jgi:Zinc-binding dehydrogenase
MRVATFQIAGERRVGLVDPDDGTVAALRAGIIRLSPPTTYPLERVADAHRDLEARRTTGSLILTV